MNENEATDAGKEVFLANSLINLIARSQDLVAAIYENDLDDSFPVNLPALEAAINEAKKGIIRIGAKNLL